MWIDKTDNPSLGVNINWSTPEICTNSKINLLQKYIGKCKYCTTAKQSKAKQQEQITPTQTKK